ncbi:hypothetical protein [Levilactobacillus namurensis]|uniref:hypothetical protein n=1 Tax=Levilactobacillus namurensis TaxID=380393 RepID=UPI00222F8D6D|nr:hypothetical protein [Levilactobacillus namurensis]MCW3777917.1 hypothetical protein [Levilactobacillus namurensis]MDT7018266.1 hypothetical protein [Levilactobacillus namurensis]WNN64747.1 hypothetical protein RIN67_08485 [Levilactobacillus namurensis]
MKYNEFKKAVEGLSKHYEVKNRSGIFQDSVLIEFKGKAVGTVHNGTFDMQIMDGFSLSIPYSKKLYMLMAEFSMTPVAERKEHRWNVIIGRDVDDVEVMAAYRKSGFNGFDFQTSDCVQLDDLKDDNLQFTDEECDLLIKELKRLPDGDRLAKIAKLGKVPAPEVDDD